MPLAGWGGGFPCTRPRPLHAAGRASSWPPPLQLPQPHLGQRVPNEKTPRGASITDDDLTAHRRHGGITYAYEFSMDQLVARSVLPICRSSYNEMTGCNYNIGLVVPYDNI